MAYSYDGFWLPMDTAKDRARYDELWASGKPPWVLWRKNGERGAGSGERALP
jgi:glucose-1-phosphate cytidylyltransferase